MSWYKQVFTGEAPSKDGPPIMRGLPRIADQPFDEEALASLQSKSELNYIFSNKFDMKGIPLTDVNALTDFLNNKQLRENNPANLPGEVSGWNPAINIVKGVNNTVANFLISAYSYIDPIKWFYLKKKSVNGGGKTQKRAAAINHKKSQKKHYSE